MANYGAHVHSVYDMPHDSEIIRHGIAPGRTVTEAERETPVIRDVDVIVVGGGPGGTAAAVTAARNGAKTILLERYGHLGGMATGGLVNIIPNLSDIYGRQWLGGFCQEFIDRMAARGAADFPPKEKWGSDDAALVGKYAKANMGHFYIRQNREGKKISLYTAVIDPEVGKDELARMVEESGAEMLLHTWVVAPILEGNTVRGVLVENKAGRQALLGKIVIDATGDGDLLMHTPTETVDYMRPGSRIAQFGYVYWICGVDLAAYDAFADAHPDELKAICDRIRAEGGRPIFCRGLLEHQSGVVWLHRLIGSLHQTEPEEMTFIDAGARRTAVRTWELFKQYMPGFQNSFIMLSAPQLGTSGGRRIVGEYYLTEDDMDRDEPYPDTIAIFPDNDRGEASLQHPKTYVPFRALLPKDIEGLLVACRAFSADHEFSEFFNLIPHCMCFGQAAGAAAAIAVREGISPKAVPFDELRALLLAGGAILPE